MIQGIKLNRDISILDSVLRFAIPILTRPGPNPAKCHLGTRSPTHSYPALPSTASADPGYRSWSLSLQSRPPWQQQWY